VTPQEPNVEQAILAAAAKAAAEMKQIAVALPTGRPVMLAVHGDMTDSEWLAFIGMLPAIRDDLRREWNASHPSPTSGLHLVEPQIDAAAVRRNLARHS